MIDAAHRESRRWGHRVLALAVAACLAGAIQVWAWNTLAVELFGLSEVGFKHAAALLAALTALLLYGAAVVRMLAHVWSSAEGKR